MRSQPSLGHSTWPAMRIDRIGLHNFHAFSDREVTFRPGINVLIGENGTGKTALLEALLVGAASFFLGFDGLPTQTIHRDDARLVTRNIRDTVESSAQFPVTLLFEGEVFGESLKWARGLSGRSGHTTHKDAADLRMAVEQRASALAEGALTEPLPLIAYYGTWRLWRTQRSPGPTGTKRARSRLDGYASCLDAGADDKRFLGWFKAMEWTEYQEGKPPLALLAVREAVRTLVEGCVDLRFRAKEGELVAIFEDGRRLPTRLLSDGFRTVLGLAADLAWRASTLNPELGERATQETPGVVLIDEIDLHLHPNWQRRIIDDLRRLFPRVQFFLTTHSPFIVQSLRSDEVIPLAGTAHLDKQPFRRSVEEVASDVMGVEHVKRSERFVEMENAARELYALLDAGGKDPAAVAQARARYLALVQRYSDEPAFLALLNAQGVLRGVNLEAPAR
jgi:predicted ATP-binding protein involved in virulence